MGAVRTLYTDLKLRSADALKGLVAYGRQWQAVEKVVAGAASSIERSADRAAAAMARMVDGAVTLRGAGGGGGGGVGSGGGGRGPDPAAVAARQQRAEQAAKRREEANERRAEAAARRLDEQRQRAAQREAARRSRARPGADPLDGIVADAARSSARTGGLADGARAVRDATAALGPFATKAERAKAAVKDLEQQVARNRKEMADLKAESVRTGDANGTLKGRMQGLAASTAQASASLSRARGELRGVTGGLIDAVKGAGRLRERFGALQVAAGNLIAGGLSRAWAGVTDAIAASTVAAMNFEKGLVDIAKVAKGTDDTVEGMARIKAGVKDASRELGVMPEQVAALTAQLTAGFSGKEDLVALTKDVTKIGVAWDISGQQAGEFFRQTSAGLQLNATETKSLFGSVNQLGNELGIKSSEIAEAMTRSAGVLKGANLSGETGAAINATLIKAGASAEVAATGVRTFIARLGAGEAATDKQLKAFEALGLSAEAVAKNLSSGDAARAEKQIQDVVKALVEMGEKAPEKRMATLIELFGSESIGSIGAAATATETLAQAFGIAGDKAAALTSVQAEYDRVSNTTAARVDKLKASVGVLAIEFGEALLPHVDKVVAFLTSPEGQEWGRGAVEKAVGAVTALTSAIGTIAGAFSSMADTIGTATTAVGALGLAMVALTGPYGMVLAASTALGAYLGQMYVDWRAQSAETALQVESNLNDVALSLANANGVFGTTSDVLAQMSQRVDESGRAWAEWMLKIVGTSQALEEFYAKDAARRGLKVEQGRKDENKARRASVDAAEKAYAQRTQAAGVANEEAIFDSKDSRPARSRKSGEQARFDALSAKVRAGQKLRPSESAEYTALSKRLDEAKASKRGKGRSHKQTKMDRQLAAIDGDVRGVLTSGGERDAGGDLKVHDDALSRAVYDRATKGRGGTDRSDGAGIGPGPNITNTYINTNVALAIDARSTGGVPENIRSAGMEVAGKSAQVFTGVAKLLGQRNAGGVMRGPV